MEAVPCPGINQLPSERRQTESALSQQRAVATWGHKEEGREVGGGRVSIPTDRAAV